jgi:hypothetical protein
MVDCTTVFECEPLSPEAGAPSLWYFKGQQGVCECAAASCDPGDAEAGDCFEDEDCYTVDDPCNDGMIVCYDSALPQHGCPFAEPQDGEPCSDDGQMCDYPLGDGCFTTTYCDAGQWLSVGGGCDGSGGD